jgi:NTE family protein
LNFQTRHISHIFWLILLLAGTARAETVALALSGGGARGFAHIGVLQALEEEHIEPDLIVGCSMGAVIGGLYAAGYSAEDLKAMALSTDWSSLFLDKPSRRNLFLAQKETTSRHIFAVRFRGLSPEVPLALTNGQKLSDLLFDLVQRAPYRPWPSFDDLRVRFRAVATDLNSGQPVIFAQGDLAEALRASVSLPLVFAPYRLDTLALVDGGVIENIPVGIAQKQGADFVIAVDLSTGFAPDVEVTAPWELADRVTTLMHVGRNLESRARANIVITPNIGSHGSAEFTGIDSLIQAGYVAMKAAMPELKSKLAARADRTAAVPFYSRERYNAFLGSLAPGTLPPQSYRFEGVTLLPDSELTRLPKGKNGLSRLALLRREYVDEGYTLAHATNLQMDSSRTLHSRWEEGRIRSINVHGLRRHKPWAVLREFPLRTGQVFELRKAKRGIAQIYGSDLFESVNLAVQPSDSGANLVIRVVERSSPQLRFGAGYSLERKGRGFAEFLDDNILGIGARLSLFGKYGEMDEEGRVRLTFDRFTLYHALDNALASYPTIDFTARWKREEYNFYNREHEAKDSYFFERTGGDIWSGWAFRRWGLISPGLLYESVLSSETLHQSRTNTAGLGARTIIDTKDSYPFPTRGIEVRGQYEYQWRARNDGGVFNRITGKVDGYLPAARRVVLRGRADYGWNDRQLPLWGRYQLGGEESLIGLHVAERTGNALLSGLVELRYDLISRWLAEAYVSAIYTVGAVSSSSDPLPRADDYQHGLGVSFALSTFLGPMRLVAGELLRSEWSSEHFRLYLNLGHEF